MAMLCINRLVLYLYAEISDKNFEKYSHTSLFADKSREIFNIKSATKEVKKEKKKVNT